MGYRIRYQVNVEFIPPGVGPMGGTGANLPGAAPTGVGPTKAFFSGTEPSSPTFTATDITNLLAAMSTDLSTQMNANIAQVQAFAIGGA